MAKARERFPTHPHVLKLMRDGIEITEFHRLTPIDVARYRKSFSNNFHDGCSDTIFEMMDLVEPSRKSWSAHATANRITVDSCAKKGEYTYDKRKAKHILDHFECFGETEVWADACALHDTLKTFGVYDELQILGGAIWDFESVECKKPSIIIKNMRLVVEGISRYSDAHSPWVIQEAIMQASLLMIPAVEEHTKTFTGPFLFSRARKDLEHHDCYCCC